MVRSFRDALSEALNAEVECNDKIMLLTADVARAVRIDNFLKKHEANYVSCGIAEANLIGVAAGLASVGLEPVIVGFSMFIAEKPFEQIRNIVAYPGFNVKIIATHGGLCVGQDGATHQALEDLAIMRLMPKMSVMTACDVPQTKGMIHEICRHTGPVYLRLGRDRALDIYEGEAAGTRIGGADLLRDGVDVVIIAAGLMVENAMAAANELKKHSINAAVINAYSIKPLCKELIEKYLKICGCAVTAEDHQIACGLGGAVCELAGEVCPVPIERVGVKDTFGESGDQNRLYEKYGLNSDSIVDAALKAYKRKKG
jgi:hypothetical protein